MNMRGGGMDIMMELAQGIIDAALAEGCDAIVIGLPVTSQGSLRRRQTDSQQGRRCRNFADAVAALTAGKDLFVYLVDERGTTLEAESLIGYLGGGRNEVKKKKDTVAAALILSAFFQNYRDAMRVRPPGMGRNTQPRRNNTAPSKGQKSNVEKKKTTTPVVTTKETTPSRTAPHTSVDDTF